MVSGEWSVMNDDSKSLNFFWSLITHNSPLAADHSPKNFITMHPNPNDKHSQISYVEEFSLPPYFFDKNYLDNADLYESHVKANRSPTMSVSVSGCPMNDRNIGIDHGQSPM